MDIMLIATWNGKKGEIYTDLDLSDRVVGAKVHHISEWNADNGLFIGHNLHGEFKGSSMDLLQEVKKASADYFDHEGKRYNLYDLARWNKCRSIPTELITNIRRRTAWIKGQHIKVARWAIEDARLCYDLYQKLEKRGEVKISDALTGKRPTIPISFHKGEEEE